jgi:hypothetical protein
LQRCIFGIFAVAELVPNVLRILDVALGIHNDGAENSVYWVTSAQPFSDLLVIEALGSVAAAAYSWIAA